MAQDVFRVKYLPTSRLGKKKKKAVCLVNNFVLIAKLNNISDISC